ncbi:hypothetical protein [Archaeoglobus sp.]
MTLTALTVAGSTTSSSSLILVFAHVVVYSRKLKRAGDAADAGGASD